MNQAEICSLVVRDLENIEEVGVKRGQRILLLDLYSAMNRLDESKRCDGAEPS